MSVIRLVNSQSNARSGLRAELSQNKRMPDSYIRRRNKIRKYNLPDNWHVGFKNKCFYCEQHVNGVDGMKGHIRSCKAKMNLDAHDEDGFGDDNLDQDDGGDDAVHENELLGPINFGITTYLLMQRILLIKETRIKTGNCHGNDEMYEYGINQDQFQYLREI